MEHVKWELAVVWDSPSECYSDIFT